MKQTLWLSCIFSIVIFSSCQKEVVGEIAPATGGTTSPSNANDYQPVTAGSEWNYTSTSVGNYKLKSLGGDTLINGVKHYRFARINDQGTSPLFISKEKGIYTSYGFYDVVGASLTYIDLVDSAVGTTWTNTITQSGISNYHTYKISAKGIKYTVLSKEYNNVIESDYDLVTDDPISGGKLKMGEGKRFYAKGVGAIEAYYNISLYGMVLSDTTRLVSYTIK